MHPDLKALQGAWLVKSLKTGGQVMDPATLTEARIVVDGDRFASTGVGAVYEGTLKLDPPNIDMLFDAGPEKGNTNLGIYELKGDSWKLCLATTGSVRPKKFAAPAGTGIALETLVRGTSAATKSRAGKKAAPAASGPATEFEGEWSMVSAVMDGKPMEQSLVQWVKRTFQGNQSTVTAGPQTMLKVSFTHDAAGAPQTIDYVILAGAHKGKRQQGIYKVDAGVLSICVGPPEASRATEFVSVAGDGRTLSEWKRTS